MKICKNCGVQNDDNLIYCSNCNNPLNNEVAAPSPIPSEVPLAEPKPIDTDIPDIKPETPQNEETVVQSSMSIPEPNIIETPVPTINMSNTENNKGSIGLGLVGFLIPIIGIILFFVMKKEKPGKAKSAGVGALISIILCFIIGIIVFLFTMFKGVDNIKNNVNENVDNNIKTNENNNSNNNNSYQTNSLDYILGYWVNDTKTIIFALNKAESSVSSGDYYFEMLGEGIITTSNSVTYDSSKINVSDKVISYTITNNRATLNIDGKRVIFNKITKAEFSNLEKELSGSVNDTPTSEEYEESIYDEDIIGIWSGDNGITLTFKKEQGSYMVSSSTGYSASFTMDENEIEIYNHGTYKYELNKNELILTDTKDNKVIKYSRK